MRSKLHWWILVGMVVGLALGAGLHALHEPDTVRDSAVYQAADGLATIFLHLLKLVVVPLVLFSLIGGCLGMGDLARVGRMGGKTFALYVTTSLVACLTGLALVNLIRPGVGLTIDIGARTVEKEVPESFWRVIENMVPENVVRAAADMDLIGVIVFSLLFGIFTLALEPTKRAPLVAVIDAAGEVMLRMTHFVISLAPVGIAALIARMIATTGLAPLVDLKWYILTVACALGFHVLVTLPILIRVTTGRNPYRFLRAMSPALATGFSTASSSGTLGMTLERAEEAGVSNRVASFVLPLGATVNMDGTALYEIVTVLFIAQLHAGIDPGFSLGIGQQLLIVFLGLTVSIGAAGIPHAGLVMMVIILQAVGLPIEYTSLIWAVDRPLDMARTATNIASDSSVALIVAHGEGEVRDVGA